MEIKGKVTDVFPLERGVGKQSGKEWKKATIIVEYGEGDYPRKVALDCFKKAAEFSAIPLGRVGTFQIDLESREFNGRWYTSATCWKWELEEQTPPPPAPAPVHQAEPDALPF